jgi:CBS domain-containing protein
MKSPVVVVKRGSKLGDVAGVFQENHISGAPVVAEDGRIVGIVTEYDIIKKSQELRIIGLLDTSGWVSPHTSVNNIARFVQGLCTIHDIPVEEAMTRDVIAVERDTALEQVARLMVNRRVNRLPVLEDGRPVGIITRKDLIWAIVNLCDINPGILEQL